MRARSAWSAASRWTATSSLFGKDIHSLDAGLPYPYNAPDEKVLGLAAHPTSAFATAFQEAQMTTTLRTQLGDHWPLKTDETGDQDLQEGESMLEHLFNYTNDHTILRDEILNITTAGRGKTTSLLTFTVYMLAGHLDLLAKLRKEILRVGGPTVRPTFDDCRPMKLLRVSSNFQELDSKTTISCDAWMSSNQHPFLALVAHTMLQMTGI
ncbi:hypothetical protein K438DRAFT_2031483 [Mycena galopus ATCC 62051]|nr:hypothetical protein K438DRAFT_2031483 [Mycena galopus ATCC 62051]